MTETSFPLTPLEKLPVKFDRAAIEAALSPFLLDGEAGKRAWKKNFASRRRGTLKRLVKRLFGFERRDSKAIQAEYHRAWSVGYDKYDVGAGPRKPKAWQWNDRKLALDGAAATRLRSPLLAAVIEELKPRRVLEVGCGNGMNLISLACHFPEVEFTGIDLTPAGIEVAQTLQAESELPRKLVEYIPLEYKDPDAFKRIRFLIGSAADLPFADREFDLVYTVLAVEQMERIRDAALSEIARVSSGHVLMLEPFRDANSRGVRRFYTLSRNYFRGSIAGLEKYGLKPLWATGDFPQKASLGSSLVLARKAAPAH